MAVSKRNKVVLTVAAILILFSLYSLTRDSALIPFSPLMDLWYWFRDYRCDSSTIYYAPNLVNSTRMPHDCLWGEHVIVIDGTKKVVQFACKVEACSDGSVLKQWDFYCGVNRCNYMGRGCGGCRGEATYKQKPSDHARSQMASKNFVAQHPQDQIVEFSEQADVRKFEKDKEKTESLWGKLFG